MRRNRVLCLLIALILLVQMLPVTAVELPAAEDTSEYLAEPAETEETQPDESESAPAERAPDANADDAEQPDPTQPSEPEDPDTPEEPVTGMDAFQLDDAALTCSFTDVPAGQWYWDSVAYASSIGLVSGRSEGIFAPDGTMTAAEAIALSVRVYRKYYGISEPVEAVTGPNWYAPYVTLAQQYRLLPSGMTNLTSSGWNKALTRSQAAAVFCLALPETELPAINAITSVPDVGENYQYRAEILKLYNAGVLRGNDDYGTYRPNQSISRAEFVKLLFALLRPAQRQRFTLKAYEGMKAFDLTRYTLNSTFRDVASSSWYYTYIAAQQTIGLLRGTSDTTFSPESTVTLAEALTVAVRVHRMYLGITEPVAGATGEQWYLPYVDLAKRYGILQENWTAYNAPLSRARLCALMSRALPQKELPAINTIQSIPDMTASNECYTQVLLMFNAGILLGNDKYGTFYPNRAITRGEFSAVLSRLIAPAQRQHFTPVTSIIGEPIVYGTSGAGRNLYAYQYGNGKNVMVVGFAIHGFEDNFYRDGQELVYAANQLKATLEANISTIEKKGWTVYVLPTMNPDGLNDGYSHNGPGRCTTTYLTSSGSLSSAHGIDMNRSFPSNFISYSDSRNYNGGRPLACRESAALAAFVKRVKGSGKNVCIDTHGWTQQIITSTGTGGLLYNTFHNAFSGNSYASCTYARGYLTAYTTSLGYNSCLFEFPSNVYSHNQFLSSGYCSRYVSCIMTLLNRY